MDLTQEDESEVCEAIKNEFDETNTKINLTSPMTYGEMLRLAAWNMKYDFGSLQSSVVDTLRLEGMEWKRSIIELLTQSFMKSCPNEYVDHGFVKTIESFFLIYLSSAKTFIPDMENSQWQELMQSLTICAQNSVQIPFSSTGFEVKFNIFVMIVFKKYLRILWEFFPQISALVVDDPTADNRGAKRNMPILPPKEIADQASEIDVIIDSMWWMFSFAFGNCYRFAQSKTNFAARMKKLMYQDFFEPMKHRWCAELNNDNPISILSLYISISINTVICYAK